MSILTNLPVLCTLIYLPKRLKSGKKSVETEEWDFETNESPISVHFTTSKIMASILGRFVLFRILKIIY